MEVVDKPEVSESEIKRAAFVQGLRELADYLESKGDDLSLWGKYDNPSVELAIWTFSEESFTEQGRALGGRREKILQHGLAIQRRSFGPHHIDVNVGRETVCERVVVGTETVEARPAEEAYEREVVEWRCPGYDKVASFLVDPS